LQLPERVYTDDVRETESEWHGDLPFDASNRHHVRIRWNAQHTRFTVGCDQSCDACWSRGPVADERLIRLYRGALPPAGFVVDSARV